MRAGTTMDLMQVHNLLDLDTHARTLRDWKTPDRIRYLGITHYHAGAHADLERLLKTREWDFAQFNYSLAEPEAEARLLPACAELGVAVIVNRPFAEGALFRRVKGRELPPWAAEIDCASWAQFFLKWIVSHPAVTCAIPGTSRVAHLEDNLKAATGRLAGRGNAQAHGGIPAGLGARGLQNSRRISSYSASRSRVIRAVSKSGEAPPKSVARSAFLGQAASMSTESAATGVAGRMGLAPAFSGLRTLAATGRVLALLALAGALTLASGCAMVQMGYTHLDTLAAWKADEYFDLDPAAEAGVSRPLRAPARVAPPRAAAGVRRVPDRDEVQAVETAGARGRRLDHRGSQVTLPRDGTPRRAGRRGAPCHAAPGAARGGAEAMGRRQPPVQPRIPPEGGSRGAQARARRARARRDTQVDEPSYAGAGARHRRAVGPDAGDQPAAARGPDTAPARVPAAARALVRAAIFSRA